MSKIITKQMLEDKLEGLEMARQVTLEENDRFKFEQIIKHYKIVYKEFTGVDYDARKK